MSYSIKDFKRQLADGLLDKNPVLAQMLGMCSTLAVTTSIANAVGMGLAVTAVLACSNVFISLLRNTHSLVYCNNLGLCDGSAAPDTGVSARA